MSPSPMPRSSRTPSLQSQLEELKSCQAQAERAAQSLHLAVTRLRTQVGR